MLQGFTYLFLLVFNKVSSKIIQTYLVVGMGALHGYYEHWVGPGHTYYHTVDRDSKYPKIINNKNANKNQNKVQIKIN